MSLKKFVFRMCLLLIFIGTAGASIALFRVWKPSKPFLTTTSPKATYLLQFTGSPDRPKFPFVCHRVDFSVIKNQQVYVADEFVHSGDWMDISFELAYPNHRWVSEQVLQLYDAELFNTRQTERRIRVINRTSETVQYLRVKSEDSFLLLELQPGSTTILEVSAERGDFRWIEVEGRFSNNRSIDSTSRNFDVESNRQSPLIYDVIIDESGASIAVAG